LSLVAAPVRETGPARRIAVIGTAAELGAATRLERGKGVVGEAFTTGRAGSLLRAAKACSTIGALGAATLAGRSRTAAALSGAALLTGSALTRFGIFEAGRASTQDPKYVVVPQRARLASNLDVRT
jgi:hypothetical protein